MFIMVLVAEISYLLRSFLIKPYSVCLTEIIAIYTTAISKAQIISPCCLIRVCDATSKPVIEKKSIVLSKNAKHQFLKLCPLLL